jgi:hypothetical protein
MEQFIKLLNNNGKIYDIKVDGDSLSLRFDNIQSSSRASVKNIMKKCGIDLPIKTSASKTHLGSTIVYVG